MTFELRTNSVEEARQAFAVDQLVELKTKVQLLEEKNSRLNAVMQGAGLEGRFFESDDAIALLARLVVQGAAGQMHGGIYAPQNPWIQYQQHQIGSAPARQLVSAPTPQLEAYPGTGLDWSYAQNAAAVPAVHPAAPAPVVSVAPAAPAIAAPVSPPRETVVLSPHPISRDDRFTSIERTEMEEVGLGTWLLQLVSNVIDSNWFPLLVLILLVAGGSYYKNPQYFQNLIPSFAPTSSTPSPAASPSPAATDQPVAVPPAPVPQQAPENTIPPTN